MSRLKPKPWVWITCLLLLAMLLCGLVAAIGFNVAQDLRNPQRFVVRDIVYQASDFHLKYVGFVNSDGSNNEIAPLREGMTRPAWSLDGNTLYFIDPPSQVVPGGVDYPGYIAIWRQGQPIRECGNPDWFNISAIGTVANHGGNNLALLDRGQFWLLVNLDSCMPIKQISLPGDGRTVFARDPSLSSDAGRIVYVQVARIDQGPEVDTIAILAVDTGQITSVTQVTATPAQSPTLSPDGHWIAYWGGDGIHRVSSNGSQDKLLAGYPYLDPTTGAPYGDGIPEPKWSPDSQWVVYHKCVNPRDGCERVGDYSIFKANIATGQEYKIVDQGLYPYWRNR